MRSPLSVFRLFVLSAFFCQAAWAQTEQDWTLESGVLWRSKTLSVSRFFQIGINGQSTPYRTAMDALDAAAKAAKVAAQPDPNDAATKASASGGSLQHTMNFAVKPFTVERVVRRDDRRNALLIMDTVINTQDQESTLQLDYSTPLSGQGEVRFNGTISQNGEMRDHGNGLPDGIFSAIILAEKPGVAALPMFIWGQPEAKWPAVVQDSGSTLRLRYEGTVPGKGKVAFVHWIITAGLDPKAKLERTFDLFLKGSKVIDPDLPAETAAAVVNFTAEALGASSAPGPADEPLKAGKLLALDSLTSKLDLKRGDQGLLWMNKDEQMAGEITVEKVFVRDREREREYPVSQIAALRGGSGRGREHRLYLRDGSVLTGVVRLEKGNLKGELGNIALNAESMELLLWPISTEDGRVPEGAVEFVQMLDGSQKWLVKGPAEPDSLEMVAAFGKLKIESADLWTLQRKTEPPYCMVATLTDGSRIQGVVAGSVLRREIVGEGAVELPLAEVVRWGAVEAALKEMTGATAPKENASPATGDVPGQYTWLREGSLLVGTLREDQEIHIRTRSGALTFKPEAVSRIFWEAGTGNEAAVELANGTKVRGEILNETLVWKLDKQVVSLPVGLITEIVRKEAKR